MVVIMAGSVMAVMVAAGMPAVDMEVVGIEVGAVMAWWSRGYCALAQRRWGGATN